MIRVTLYAAMWPEGLMNRITSGDARPPDHDGRNQSLWVNTDRLIACYTAAVKPGSPEHATKIVTVDGDLYVTQTPQEIAAMMKTEALGRGE